MTGVAVDVRDDVPIATNATAMNTDAIAISNI
jgi:hypothetical protein